MSGTKAGGARTKKTIIERYGKDYYNKLGKQGSAAGDPKKRGFAVNRELAREAGRRGGKVSSRALR